MYNKIFRNILIPVLQKLLTDLQLITIFFAMNVCFACIFERKKPQSICTIGICRPHKY